ncbi:MAG: glutamate--tRNA ligase [Deltaproteobacteria bacterium]|nr:MAG: glutamate--tRNA ligase [Deltaproteobacteria bacterium]
MDNVVTRFSPSPTGTLHIGGARTALFNWLFARHNKGKFILRIEDTDIVRSAEEYTQVIIESMQWLGMDWDEGPYFQSKRLDVYRKYIEILLEKGRAYYCDCSPEEVERKRKEAMAAGKKPKYDGKCRTRNLGPGPGRVVRFRAPDAGTTVVHDLIKGVISFDNSELDDLVIQRSDGMPTYNFAVVVDDLTMGITHVIRGDDHVNNTPRQILIYEALGETPPVFAHVPMILGQDRTRLSKRHGATSVLAYRDAGYLPEAMVNYLVRLGWSCGDQEIFSKEELIEKFSLDNIGKSASIFDPEKLLWLNSHYIKEYDLGKLAKLIVPFLKERNYQIPDQDYLKRAIVTLQPRAKTLSEMADMMDFYLLEEIEYEPKAAKKFLKPSMIPVFEDLIRKLDKLDEFTEQELEQIFRGTSEELGVKLGKIAQPVRVALTGRTASPGLFEVIDILGKKRTIRRLEAALEYMKRRAEN